MFPVIHCNCRLSHAGPKPTPEVACAITDDQALIPMTPTAKKWNHVFGPVPSRRLGLSLGVDVIPRKVCTLDCVYCEVGMTDKRALRRREYFPAESIVAEVQEALAQHTPLDYISFSGSGEPTLNLKLGEIIRAVKQMTSIPVGVITNGTLLYLEDVRFDLLAADVVLPSLDAVTQEVFERIDRPHPSLRIDTIIEGLRKFRGEYKGQLWLEILFAAGYNDHQAEVLKMKDVVELLQPDKIHLNTVIRPPSEQDVMPVSQDRLKEIQALFGPRCEIVGVFDKHHAAKEPSVSYTQVLSLLERRAMTVDGLADAMGASKEAVLEILQSMEEAGQAESFDHQKERHFRAVVNGDPEERVHGS